jgi:hypothetical protein
MQEKEVRLSGAESHVERMKEVQRTLEGEIAFLRARLDFHMQAAATMAQRNAGQGSEQTWRVPEAADVRRLQEVLEDMRKQFAKLEEAKQVSLRWSCHACERVAGRMRLAQYAVGGAACSMVCAALQLQGSGVQEDSDKLAAADAGRQAAETRLEHAQRVTKQLQLALDSARLTVARTVDAAGAAAFTANTAENAVPR